MFIARINEALSILMRIEIEGDYIIGDWLNAAHLLY